MSEPRPDVTTMRDLVIDDLRGTFGVLDVDDDGFTLEHDGVSTRVRISAAELGRYAGTIEDSAYEAIGLEPRWRSSVSLVAVHVMEEVAMATAGTEVVLMGDAVVRRDPLH